MTLARGALILAIMSSQALAYACAANPRSRSLPAGAQVVRMSRNVVGGATALGTLVLNVEKTTLGDSSWYELVAWWNGMARVNIETGESLTILADRTPLEFSTTKGNVFSDWQCDGACIYDDRAYYPASAEQVRAIAAASSVTVILRGSRRTVERDFHELNFERFQEFVAAELPRSPS
jgi:hypothetical protein